LNSVKHETTVTFVGEDRRVSDPIAVPLWSTVTLSDRPGRPMIYMGASKMVLYSGPYEVDGKQYPAPAMRLVTAETRLLPRPKPKRRRKVTVPLWFAILFGITFCSTYMAMIWFAIY